MNDFPVRKQMRLPCWNYSSEGAYFLTLCSRNRKPIFSHIVGRGILDAPDVCLTGVGEEIHNAVMFLSENAKGMVFHNWVIMPNHVHILLSIVPEGVKSNSASESRYPANAAIPKFVSSLKRFTNRKSGIDLWQTGYFDHIIRDDEDFIRRWRYIDNNPVAWLDDDYYPE